MTKRLDWDKAKSDRIKGWHFEPADTDMVHEPEHQDWWCRKSSAGRAASRKKVEKEMADAFSRGHPTGIIRPKEVISALISPAIKKLLEQSTARAQKREQISQGLFSRAKAKTKKRKSKH